MSSVQGDDVSHQGIEPTAAPMEEPGDPEFPWEPSLLAAG